jgi:hypothetical protein
MLELAPDAERLERLVEVAYNKSLTKKRVNDRQRRDWMKLTAYLLQVKAQMRSALKQDEEEARIARIEVALATGGGIL